jgi:hypothetical protein
MASSLGAKQPINDNSSSSEEEDANYQQSTYQPAYGPTGAALLFKSHEEI